MKNCDSAALLVMEATSSASPTKLHTSASAAGTITSLESLQQHLQWAIELEPLSIEPGRNAEATEVLSSVMGEEMLHLVLAANLLNAQAATTTGYPRDAAKLSPLPHRDRLFEISLSRFGPAAIETFLKIERSSRADDPAGQLPEDRPVL